MLNVDLAKFITSRPADVNYSVVFSIDCGVVAISTVCNSTNGNIFLAGYTDVDVQRCDNYKIMVRVFSNYQQNML